MPTHHATSDEFLLVGTIGLPFGIKGQVKLHTVTNRPEHLIRLKTVFLGDEHVATRLRRAAMHKHAVMILTLEGVDDRNAAETLRGTEVYIRQKDAAPLDEDEYFLHDLPGLQVETTAGEVLGTVSEVLETGANDVLVVKRTSGEEALIPMTREVVKSLDIDAKRVIIEPIQGLLD
jgi:16S rRNA processing protein RimM